LICELIFESCGSLFSKQATKQVEGKPFCYDSVIFYQYFAVMISYFVSALIHERAAFDKAAETFSLKLVGVLVFSGVFEETADLMYMQYSFQIAGRKYGL
jgi:hypothetical protein